MSGLVRRAGAQCGLHFQMRSKRVKMERDFVCMANAVCMCRGYGSSAIRACTYRLLQLQKQLQPQCVAAVVNADRHCSGSRSTAVVTGRSDCRTQCARRLHVCECKHAGGWAPYERPHAGCCTVRKCTIRFVRLLFAHQASSGWNMLGFLSDVRCGK